MMFTKTTQESSDELVRAASKNDARIAIAEDLIKVLVEQEKDLLSPEWTRITTRYLPAELRRLEHNRSDNDIINPLDPLYEKKQLIADGQIKECLFLIGKLSNIRAALQVERKVLLDCLKLRVTLQNKSRTLKEKLLQS